MFSAPLALPWQFESILQLQFLRLPRASVASARDVDIEIRERRQFLGRTLPAHFQPPQRGSVTTASATDLT
jgi:hypothetical protein